MPSAVEPVSPADLVTWPTKRLLALRDRLLRCEADIEHSDIQRPEDRERLDPSLIHFKDDPRWSDLYQTVKRILSAREHVPRSEQRAAARRSRAERAASHERARPPSRMRRR